jgi:hypothetical protein
MSNISYLNSLPPPFSYISLSPIPGIVSTGLIFPFTYMCTQYLHHIHPPTPFLHISPFPLVPTPPPGRTCSAPILWLCKRKEKNDIFCLFKILHREFYCDTSMDICIIAQIGPTPLFFFFLPQSLSYGGFSYFKFLYSFLCREYISHINLLNFLLLPSLSHMWLPLSITCFS